MQKEELPFAEELDKVTVLATDTSPAATLGVFGEKSIAKWTPPPAARRGVDYNVTGLFEDGSLASFAMTIGKGRLHYTAYHPGLSYMHPAIPRRPVDRVRAHRLFLKAILLQQCFSRSHCCLARAIDSHQTWTVLRTSYRPTSTLVLVKRSQKQLLMLAEVAPCHSAQCV